MPYGRGGAGNIEAAQWDAVAHANKKVSDDLEANRQDAENASRGGLGEENQAGRKLSQDFAIPDEQRKAPTPSSAQQQYAYTGRGGAGNWYSPQALNTGGTFASSGGAPEDSTSAPMRSTKMENTNDSRLRGRGGAGNYVWSEAEQEAARKQQEKKEIELQDIVRGDVEAGLPKPPQAYFGGTTEEKDQGMNAEALRTLWS